MAFIQPLAFIVRRNSEKSLPQENDYICPYLKELKDE
jgi:hypothetical protein